MSISRTSSFHSLPSAANAYKELPADSRDDSPDPSPDAGESDGMMSRLLARLRLSSSGDQEGAEGIGFRRPANEILENAKIGGKEAWNQTKIAGT
jgi:hypothetical protein